MSGYDLAARVAQALTFLTPGSSSPLTESDLVATQDTATTLADCWAEVRRLQAQVAEWNEKAKSWMASPEAAKRLEGYQALGAQVAAAENARGQAEARVARLEAALRGLLEVLGQESYDEDDLAAALAEGTAALEGR